MGCHDGGPGPSDWEVAQEKRDYRFRALIEKLKKVEAGWLTVEELMIITKMNVAGAFHFPPKVSDDDIKLLEAAVRRVEMYRAGFPAPDNAMDL